MAKAASPAPCHIKKANLYGSSANNAAGTRKDGG
jgi:hypothetical protein